LKTSAPSVAVLIPCHNESLTIRKVIQDFRLALPAAMIYVYDNNSTDDTRAIAVAEDAIVGSEALQGKGHVVRRMFADIDADIYVLVDGDDTYQASSAPIMVQALWNEHLDMFNGTRVTQIVEAYRRGHRLGNVILTGLVQKTFGNRIKDMLSGYRVFSKRFVKSFPALSAGFEIETELTIHALELNMPIGEMETPYKERPAGSSSKLRTYSDGLRILRTIIFLVKEERPLLFFSVVAFVLFDIAIILGMPIFQEFHRTHLVPRFPTAILCASLMLLSFLAMVCGLVLDSVSRGRKEVKRMAYLSIPVGFRPLIDVEGLRPDDNTEEKTSILKVDPSEYWQSSEENRATSALHSV
jgi:glycosyltransferase involved in cell wall biosynthesis